MAAASVVTIALVGLVGSFWGVIALSSVWALLFAATMPIRQAYLNAMIPSRQRATILSFDSLMDSAGGVWGQPVLGRTADAWGYGPSYLVAAGIAAVGVPFLALSGRRAERSGAGRGRRATTVRPHARSVWSTALRIAVALDLVRTYVRI